MSSKPIEIHFEKSLNNLNLVQEADVRQRREYLVVTGLFIVMALGVLAYGWQHYQNLDLRFQIEAATRNQAQMVKTRENLRSTRQFLRSSERVHELARKMGLVPLAPGQLQMAPSNEMASPEVEADLAARHE